MATDPAPISISDYNTALENFDWYYDFSENPDERDQGRQRADELFRIRDQSGLHHYLYGIWAMFMAHHLCEEDLQEEITWVMSVSPSTSQFDIHEAKQMLEGLSE